MNVSWYVDVSSFSVTGVISVTCFRSCLLSFLASVIFGKRRSLLASVALKDVTRMAKCKSAPIDSIVSDDNSVSYVFSFFGQADRIPGAFLGDVIRRQKALQTGW